MENERFIDKVKEIINHLLSNESQIKFLSFCCVIIITLLILIAGILYNIYTRVCSFMDLVEHGEYTKVSQVFDESYKPEEVLPILGITSTTEMAEESSTKTTDSQTTSTTSNQSNTKDYVINKTNNKIHKSSCSFVDQMKDENKKSVKLSEDELNQYLNDGYTMCNTCGG